MIPPLTMFVNPSYDFTMGFDKAKRILVVFGVILIITSYLVFSKLWSQEFGKLLCDLTTSDLTGMSATPPAPRAGRITFS